MMGDLLREVAILWLALYPLEAYINRKFSWWYCVGIVLASALLMYLGMLLEGSEEP